MQPLLKHLHPPKFHPLQQILLSISSQNILEILDMDETNSPLIVSLSLSKQLTECFANIKKSNNSEQLSIWYEWIDQPENIFNMIIQERENSFISFSQDFEIDTKVNNISQQIGFVIIIPEINQIFIFHITQDKVQCRQINFENNSFLDFKSFKFLYVQDSETKKIIRLNIQNFEEKICFKLSQVFDLISKNSDQLKIKGTSALWSDY